MPETNAQLMNAPYLLNEIELAIRTYLDTGTRRTLYLSQFPMTDEDAAYLQQALGPGSVTIQTSGENRTVWRECGIAGVWWGEYYEGPKKVVLRTIEIGPFPELASTPQEDIESGLARLEERRALRDA